MNVGSLLPRHARFRGGHLAVVCGDLRLTWRELEERVNRIANALHALGLRKGDKLAYVLPNSVEVLEVILAGARMGYVLVPLSPLLRAPALQSLLQDVRRGATTVEQALGQLAHFPVRALGHSRLDTQRALRCGFPEIVFGEGKSPEELVDKFGLSARHIVEAVKGKS